MNQDEFLKCLELSKTRHAEGDFENALRLAIKAQRMSDCVETKEWLKKVRLDCEKEGRDNKDDDKKESTNNNVRQRQNIPEGSKASESVATSSQNSSTSQCLYTQEQVKEVKDFMKRNKDDYYKVLGVDKSACLDEIKKAYKKLALKFHPDKNQAPGADEAFKIISVAFSVLGDEEKRRNFDRFGAAAGSSNMNNSGFASPFGGHTGAAFNFNGQEISPEELFNLFFGAAFTQAQGFPQNHQFHHNPFTQGHFGPGQFFFSTNFGGMRPPQHQRQRRPQTNQPETEIEEVLRKLIQFIPLLIVFFLSLASSWLFPDNNTNNNSTDHLFSLNPSNLHRFPRNTRVKNVPYYATSKFQNYFGKLREEDKSSKLFRELTAYENIIDKTFLQSLKQSCEQEERQLSKLLKRAKKDQIEEIKNNFKLNSCERLKKFE